MTVPKPPDAALYNVLSALIEAGGTFDQGDPGEVLYNLADAACTDYVNTTYAVRWLEAEGWARVERLYHSVPVRANRIVKVELIDEQGETT